MASSATMLTASADKENTLIKDNLGPDTKCLKAQHIGMHHTQKTFCTISALKCKHTQLI